MSTERADTGAGSKRKAHDDASSSSSPSKRAGHGPQSERKRAAAERILFWLLKCRMRLTARIARRFCAHVPRPADAKAKESEDAAFTRLCHELRRPSATNAAGAFLHAAVTHINRGRPLHQPLIRGAVDASSNRMCLLAYLFAASPRPAFRVVGEGEQRLIDAAGLLVLTMHCAAERLAWGGGWAWSHEVYLRLKEYMSAFKAWIREGDGERLQRLHALVTRPTGALPRAVAARGGVQSRGRQDFLGLLPEGPTEDLVG